MGLITKEVTVKWNEKTRKHYESKGYIFTKTGGAFNVKIDDLLKGSKIRVDIICDNCGKEINSTYDSYCHTTHNGKHYCHQCACEFSCGKSRTLKYVDSFKQWCIDHDRQDILDRWDNDKNKFKPEDITFGSSRFIWLKCLENTEHESEGYHANNITSFPNAKLLCSKCNTIFCKRPDLIKYFPNIEDTKKYTIFSTVKKENICPDCGYHKINKICKLTTKGFSCPRCGDGISYPNKFAFSFFEQLNIPFDIEYPPKWAMGRRYDFYFKLQDKEYVVEMDGGWHYNDNQISGQTREDSNRIDEEKNKYAADNNVHMIRINSSESTLEHIKKYILLSDLNDLFDLSNIDWNKCREYTATSMLKAACNLWNEHKTIKQICEITKYSKETIRQYLIRGKELNLCDYQTNNIFYRKIICLDNNEVFNNSRKAGSKYKINIPSITAACKGKENNAGGYHWMFFDDWLKENEKQITA